MANIVSVEESIRFNAGCGPTAHPPSTCADVIHALSMYTESGSAVRVAKKRCFRHCLQCLATAADRVGHRGSHEGLSKPFQGRALSSRVNATETTVRSGQGVCRYALATSKNSASPRRAAAAAGRRAAAHRKSVGTLILKPCSAMRHLTFPSAPHLSTQVVLMGSDEHSTRGRSVITVQSRRRASCGSDWCKVMSILYIICLSSSDKLRTRYRVARSRSRRPLLPRTRCRLLRFVRLSLANTLPRHHQRITRRTRHKCPILHRCWKPHQNTSHSGSHDSGVKNTEALVWFKVTAEPRCRRVTFDRLARLGV